MALPKYGGVLTGPDQLRQVFNDTDAEVLWPILGPPEELKFLPGAITSSPAGTPAPKRRWCTPDRAKNAVLGIGVKRDLDAYESAREAGVPFLLLNNQCIRNAVSSAPSPKLQNR